MATINIAPEGWGGIVIDGRGYTLGDVSAKSDAELFSWIMERVQAIDFASQRAW